MVTRAQVDAALQKIRPYLQADGGDIELIEVHDNCADVRLTGRCVGCRTAPLTLHLGVETALRYEVPGFETLRAV